jgi:hypothetical protein
MLAMKTLLSFASVVAFCVAPALAGEGRVSDHSLANMGLGSMKAMSDVQGLQVRGLGAQAGGFSSVTLNGVGGTASSTNFYYANGKNSASGENLSVAGDVSSTITTHGSHVSTTTTINVIFAGGFSSAKSH